MADAPAQRDYSKADRNCDIVMKGGITSGIVYPLAACALAERYRFRNIGGTSAGAIAAAATAAAEYRRQTRKDPAGFRELEGLPAMLGASEPGKPSRLFSLFQPERSTAPIFNTLTAGLGKGNKWKVVPAAFRNFRGAALLALSLCALLTALWAGCNWLAGGPCAAVLNLFPSALLTLIVVPAAVALAFALRCRKAIPSNFYGLCRGSAPDRPELLTPWLTDLLNRLAGKDSKEPLTFGDLWGKDPEDPDVRLQMMTTNLTHGRPYRLPFTGNEEHLFYFDPDEFATLFPKDVVDWMVRKSEEAGAKRGSEERVTEAGKKLPHLPPAADLPVIVGVRMSLSFPGLISAVPLYAARFGGPEGDRKLQPCWFSDGGIASNFPVHFFDGWLPRWPTFAINLREGLEADFFMPKDNREGQQEWWTRFDREPGLVPFVGAILDCMQNWMDNTQLKMPGYRDRIIHVGLGEGEGGLNLDMPRPVIDRISARGAKAGEELVRRFGPGSTAVLSWDNHRWIRYRTTMLLLEEMLLSMRRALAQETPWAPPDEARLADLIRRKISELPSYEWTNDAQRKEAIAATESLLKLADELAASPGKFTDQAPRPIPELRVRPRI